MKTEDIRAEDPVPLAEILDADIQLLYTPYDRRADMTTKTIAERLEYLRGELRADRISMGELIELEDLAEYIDPSDVELLEPAGVPENYPPARWKYLRILDAHYPFKTLYDNVENARYCGVVKSIDVSTNEVSWYWYFNDDLDEIFDQMAEVTDIPEAVFDLDTGERIELHVSMVITKSEDQGIMINVLRPEES